jgi:DNA-binding PadR family transcriptional regulator
MAATETRLLLLGGVLLFEPVNGYQLRRELLSWQVEDWAHIKPGSIYSGLSTLTRQGHLTRHDLVDAGREVAVYTSTAQGRREFERLFAFAVQSVDLLAPLPFHTALSLLPLMERQVVINLLHTRLANAEAATTRQAQAGYDPSRMPPHVGAMAGLWQRMGDAECAWLREFTARVEQGEFEFRGEPARWQAHADDPGWQLAADRRRYLDLLAEQR